MARREQITQQKVTQTEDTEVQQETVEATNLDDILDEIDAVLAVNAEAFVGNFVQKGGQ